MFVFEKQLYGKPLSSNYRKEFELDGFISSLTKSFNSKPKPRQQAFLRLYTANGYLEDTSLSDLKQVLREKSIISEFCDLKVDSLMQFFEAIIESELHTIKICDDSYFSTILYPELFELEAGTVLIEQLSSVDNSLMIKDKAKRDTAFGFAGGEGRVWRIKPMSGRAWNLLIKGDEAIIQRENSESIASTLKKDALASFGYASPIYRPKLLSDPKNVDHVLAIF